MLRFTLTDDRRSTGWTRWAIWGALAPLTWLATDLLHRKEVSLARVALLSLAIFAGWRLLEMVVAMFSPSSSTTSAPTRFRIMADTINAARLQLVFTTARYGLIVFLLAWFDFQTMSLLWLYSLVALAFHGLIFAVGFQSFPFPTRMMVRPSYDYTLSFIPIAWLLAVIVQASYGLRWEWPGLNVAEIRLALVFNAVAHLLNWLASDSSAAPLLNHLTQIRQDLAFGRLSLPEATRHTDLALTGLKLAEVLHPHVSATLVAVSELEPLLLRTGEVAATANAQVSAVQNNLGEPETNSEKVAVILRAVDQLDSELKRVAAKMDDVKSAHDRFRIRSQVIAFYSPESRQEVQNIAATVTAAISNAKKTETQFCQQLASLKTAANALAKSYQIEWNCLKSAVELEHK